MSSTGGIIYFAMEFNHKFRIVTLFLVADVTCYNNIKEYIVRRNVTCCPKKTESRRATILIVLTLAYQLSLASHNDNTPAPLKVVVQFP
jgi:hypothetical protein